MLLITNIISHAIGAAMSICTLPAVGILIAIEAATTEKKITDIISEVKSGVKDVYKESRGLIIKLEEETIQIVYKIEKGSRRLVRSESISQPEK